MKPLKSKWAARLPAILVSVLVLWVATSKLSSSSLLQAFQTLDIRWFALAVLANGLLFLPAAVRWHLVLELARIAVSFGSTLRCALVGHFFYVGLFGAVGGDSARSVYYSRWFKFPLPLVLATAPLDRMLGFAGLLIFGGCGAALAFRSGAFKGGFLVPSHHPVVWVVALALVVILWLAARKFLGNRFTREFLVSLKSTAGKLLRCPRTSLGGIACGVLVQCALSGTLALNLQAVEPGTIPWTQIAWTFPVISLLGGLPVTVAGLGTREAAAIGLLGLYGISGEVALAAALLSLASTILWALGGGLLFWREERVRSEHEPFEGSKRDSGSGSTLAAP